MASVEAEKRDLLVMHTLNRVSNWVFYKSFHDSKGVTVTAVRRGLKERSLTVRHFILNNET